MSVYLERHTGNILRVGDAIAVGQFCCCYKLACDVTVDFVIGDPDSNCQIVIAATGTISPVVLTRSPNGQSSGYIIDGTKFTFTLDTSSQTTQGGPTCPDDPPPTSFALNNGFYDLFTGWSFSCVVSIFRPGFGSYGVSVPDLGLINLEDLGSTTIDFGEPSATTDVATVTFYRID